MAVTAKLYGKVFESLGKGAVDLTTGTTNLKVMLLTSSYTPNQDTHQYLSDVNSNETSGTGYTSGGQALQSVAVTYNAGNNAFILDAANTSWANSTISAAYAVVYDDSAATASAKTLVGYVDLDGTKSSTAATFQLEWDASGIVKIAAA
ncbi:hypothetical protein [Tomitella gaofuii]|uniref:hypothetical protein n=1 Tax=Tomitella gaofuii TaxID=2760083 RepID=UPI0015F8B78F|nr:hypothetical protein [Tomitella gaofuii]